jgi:hypothetical protein
VRHQYVNLGVPVRGPRHPVYVRCVDPSTLALSLSSHRHSYVSLLFSLYHLTMNNSPSCPPYLFVSLIYLSGTSGNRIVAGLFIDKTPPSYNTINLANSAESHPLLNCRLYYSQITVLLQLQYSTIGTTDFDTTTKFPSCIAGLRASEQVNGSLTV